MRSYLFLTESVKKREKEEEMRLADGFRAGH